MKKKKKKEIRKRQKKAIKELMNLPEGNGELGLHIFCVILTIIVLGLLFSLPILMNKLCDVDKQVKKETARLSSRMEETENKLYVYQDLLYVTYGEEMDPYSDVLVLLRDTAEEHDGLRHNTLYKAEEWVKAPDPDEAKVTLDINGKSVETSLSELEVVSMNDPITWRYDDECSEED